jgi:hypothetical protein
VVSGQAHHVEQLRGKAMTGPKLAETPTESKKYSFLSESLNMFNTDAMPTDLAVHVSSSLLVLNDVQRATQGITAISKLLGNSSIEEENEGSESLHPGTVFGLLVAINALSSMSEYHLGMLAETLEKASK